ncbi:hypothetical protein C4564_05340 [Candidatus Microgenomates bacterium]|nr:MAG: hypothetical protein C4564_05340 [Candidatus Microgenomates bacterium]
MDEVEDFESLPERSAPTSNKLTSLGAIFEGLNEVETEKLQADIYENYAAAMQMRDREPLSEERFYNHFYRGWSNREPKVFGSDKDGYLLGSVINEVFVPTHFAPQGLRQGYRLIKELVDADMPTALFITDDLVNTVRKMNGWKVTPVKMTTRFRGSDVLKTLVINKWSTVPKLAQYTASELAKPSIDKARNIVRNIGEKAITLLNGNRANANDIDAEVEKCVNPYIDSRQYLDSTYLRTLSKPLWDD